MGVQILWNLLDLIWKPQWLISLKRFRTKGLGFLYAPKFQPAMQIVASVRRAIGIRTVFNIVGPLTNPCTNLSGQVIGAPEPKIIETLGLALNESGMKNIMLINSRDGLDELPILAKMILL